MNRIIVALFLLFVITINSGCGGFDSNDAGITKVEAKQLVLKEHERDDNDIEIISIMDKPDKYIIRWEIEPIRNGKDSVNKKTGNLKEIESSTGTCKWR